MRTHRRAVFALLFAALIPAIALGQTPAKPAEPSVSAKKTIAVAMYDGAGVGGKGPKMLEEKFHTDTEFRITRLKAEDIRAGKLKNYQVLLVPGGSSRSEGNTLGEDGRECITKFVQGGGTFVGICAGCYLASCNYEWSLHILPVTVVDSTNWERGRGNLKLELTKDGKDWTARTDPEVTTIYHNGPVLSPQKDAKEKLIPLAIFREELTRKGAKQGLMVNTPAIAAARCGKGWAIGVSPHPEQTEDLRDIVPSTIRWALAHPAPKASTLKVAVYDDAGSVGKAFDSLIKSLQEKPEIEIVRLKASDIRRGKLAGCDLLIQPGGLGSTQGIALGEDGREVVREFVRNGGGYIGICAGAYLATCDYPWSLNILNAKVIDKENWARGFGPLDISLNKPGQTLFGVSKDKMNIYYHQGPVLAPGEKPDLPAYDSLATFEGEMTKKGAKEGLMKGTTAIATAKYGKGRVLCFSPHPEMTDGLHDMLHKGISWAAATPITTEKKDEMKDAPKQPKAN